MKYYSAPTTQQDRWVVDILASKRNGYFVDIGASNGIHASNTYALEQQLGWQGICIEANDILFKQCQRNRECIVENICVYDHHGSVNFVEPSQHPGYGGIHENLKAHKQNMWDDGGKMISKPCVPLANILDKHNAPKVIDYLSMDVEGSEPKILSVFPFDRYQFRSITIEGVFCDEILAAAGYQQIDSAYSKVTWERFYIKPEII